MNAANLRFENGEDFLAMSVVLEQDRDLPSFGDASLVVRICAHSFSGESTPWVARQAFAQFCTALQRLERSLRGEACLQSMSPNELRLRVFAIDSTGHLAIEGSAGSWVWTSCGQIWNAVNFCFEFDAEQLTRALVQPGLQIQ